MSVPTLKEGFTEWEVIINPNLKFSRAEYWKRGIKRYWGIDPTDKSQKLMYVQYPKSGFSRKDMIRILPKYRNCKSCLISKPVLTSYLSSSTDIIFPIIFISSIVFAPLLYIIKIWYTKP